MGMFDDVYCEADLPTRHPEGQRAFQTKSLFCCLDRFTITKEGRLVLHESRFESLAEAANGLPVLARIPVGDVDTDFHGDIRLTSTAENHFIEYAARFTHGSLEWIRPWSEITEFHRSLLSPSC